PRGGHRPPPRRGRGVAAHVGIRGPAPLLPRRERGEPRTRALHAGARALRCRRGGPRWEWAEGTPVTVHPTRYGTPVERLADQPVARRRPPRQCREPTSPPGAAAEYLVV